jgi:hypothetical protein
VVRHERDARLCMCSSGIQTSLLLKQTDTARNEFA